MLKKKIKYPIGWQSFEKIRTEGALYVDKTGLIADLIDNSRFVFLSRPRRFGKSLLLSTLEAYFQGQKVLFDGLEISQYEDKWEKYPVLHFDLSRSEANNPDKLEGYLNNQLAKYEKYYGVTTEMKYGSVGERFGWLIEKVSEAVNKGCVILVDEYDKGIQETIDNKDALERNQALLRPFFSQLKSQDKYIKFAMVTGVARFRHYTLFSGANNLEDISFYPQYASICGITSEELIQYFTEGLKALAQEYECLQEKVVESLKQKYDGYRFSRADIHVFNPFSLLRAFKNNSFGDYWLMSGTSKVFIDFLKGAEYDLSKIHNIRASETRLSSLFDDKDPIPLLFQTGYLTIEKYIRNNEEYLLKIPNGEVRGALFQDLAPMYLGISTMDGAQKARMLRTCLEMCDLQGFVEVLDSLIAKVPYPIFDKDSKEKAYHLIVYCLCLAVGVDNRCEEPMADGRPDLITFTDKYIYIIEFKLDKSAESAIKQIDDNGYARPYLGDGREVYRIGASFSSEKRNIQRWVVKTPSGEIHEIIPKQRN
ncbi:MAG: ATP-binding protein [Bacteroidales bacterium]|nr:ATP-binding protein [Bacteroidales bacterium]